MDSSSCMHASWGILSPNVKELIPQRRGENSPMAKPRIPLRQRLARNVRALATRDKLSGHQIAGKAKLDPKTVNNMLRAGHDPRLTHVEKVAEVFGLAAWQLLALDLESNPPDSDKVVTLLERYSAAKDDGRKAIMQVAEIASQKTSEGA